MLPLATQLLEGVTSRVTGALQYSALSAAKAPISPAGMLQGTAEENALAALLPDDAAEEEEEEEEVLLLPQGEVAALLLLLREVEGEAFLRW